MFGGNFAPRGWAFCSGQLQSIAQNTALFALLGTTYGGDGQVTFGLPDLRGRVPVHQGSGFVLGQMAGSESVTVLSTQMPQHTHAISSANTTGRTTTDPTGGVVANASSNPYITPPGNTTMGSQMVGLAGGNQPHDNMMPTLCVSFVIALEGIFPSRN